MVVDQTFVDQYWRDQDPIGKRLSFDRGEPWYEVVGVVAPIRYGHPSMEMKPEVYVPEGMIGLQQGYLSVKSASSPESILAAIRQVLEREVPGTSITEAGTLSSGINRTMAEIRFTALTGIAFGVCGFLITSFGAYALIAFVIDRRAREMAIKCALGVSRTRLLREQLAMVFANVSLGVAVGAMVCMIARERVMSAFADIDVGSLTWLLPLTTCLLYAAAFVVGIWPTLKMYRLAPARILQRGQ